jgi:hypothetical protein
MQAIERVESRPAKVEPERPTGSLSGGLLAGGAMVRRKQRRIQRRAGAA